MPAVAHDFAKAVVENGGVLKECPWELPTAASAAEAAPAKPPSAVANAIVQFGEDGSLDIEQLKKVFGMKLGTTVALKNGSSAIVFHIAKMGCRLIESEAQRDYVDVITLMGTDNSEITVTPCELVDLYKITKVKPDILVRSAERLKIEAHAPPVADYICSYAKVVFLFRHSGCSSPMYV